MKRSAKVSLYAILITCIFVFLCCEEDEDKIKILQGPSAEILGPSTVEITWETDFPGNSIVQYGLTNDLDSSLVDEEERQFHSVVLTGLRGKILYYYQVITTSSLTGTKVKSSIDEFMTGENEESLTRTGWDWFVQNNLDSAASYFEQALIFEPEYSFAYIGMGWTELRRERVEDALTNFNTGLYYNRTLLDGRVGRSAVNLSFNHYADAIHDGTYVINADSSYVFEYDNSIDFRDVRIILAQAYYAMGDFEFAQGQCDILYPDNGLDPAVPSTWVVNEATYESYPIALLNLINYLDSLY